MIINSINTFPNLSKQQNYTISKPSNLNKTNEDVFIKKNSKTTFKGSEREEAIKIFKELIKHAPAAKIESIKRIQEIAESVPHSGFFLDIAKLAHQVYHGKYTEAGVQSLLQAADYTIFAPAKAVVTGASAAKGGVIGSIFGPIGTTAGAVIGGGAALIAWSTIRNGIGSEIAKLIDDENLGGGSSSSSGGKQGDYEDYTAHNGDDFLRNDDGDIIYDDGSYW